jgi:hypothetical protein
MASIPKQYRITLKKQTEYVRAPEGDLDYYLKGQDGKLLQKELTPLGFANAYEPNSKGYADRVITQDKWAYGQYFFSCYEKDGILWKKEWRWIDNQKVEIDEPIAPELQPIIIDNVPLEGYRIQFSVSRSSTSNKVWRILDPRGFELEINTQTMEDLIMSGTIEKGLIVGPCIWKTAKMLVRV